MAKDSSLAVFVRTRRHEIGLTQKELAEAIGITKSYIDRVEHGKRHNTFSQMSDTKLMRWANGLRVPLETLKAAIPPAPPRGPRKRLIEPRTAFGRLIRKRRLLMGLTVSALAARFGIGFSYMHNLERGCLRNNLSRIIRDKERLARWAKALLVSREELAAHIVVPPRPPKPADSSPSRPIIPNPATKDRLAIIRRRVEERRVGTVLRPIA